MIQILETMIYYMEKVGLIYSCCWFLWVIFIIVFVGFYFSARKFAENSLPSKAIITSYCEDVRDGLTSVYVRIPEINEVCSIRAGGVSEDDNPVGSEIDVLYLKGIFGYDVRTSKYKDRWVLWMLFVFQAIPLVAMAGLYIYSTFINPSFHVI